ncbi:hypothetical protein CFC21_010821 [Triticum aestivum]|uniref:WD repeat domain phosphoinositide-interacting protein 3 n=3 Tax=Triticinae TaxID=1648030 RepID=A0A452Y3M3_AEGTS|nr:autophagy-related protein 18d [Aegilops tauschii subsp. strangulata]XP_044448669.1 autophagy-related protein 18d-like [Triticum aestivum]KAF6994029.1 hypothetical protein CFC21_010821 [Triticum aestivum]
MTSQVSPSQGAGGSDVEDEDVDLFSVNWNQDHSCFSAATANGLRMFSCKPFKEQLRRIQEDGGFRIVEMLFRTNIFGLVGQGADKQYQQNKLTIWDDCHNLLIGDFSFKSNIRAVKLSKDYFVVALEHEIYVYSFKTLKLIHLIDTTSNPKGLCCLSHHADISVMACPGMRQGIVRVEHFGSKETKFITAHDSNISCMTLTVDGLLLATASVRGTLIRIFNTMDGACLQEVRRGVDKAEIYSIALSPNLQWLAVSSDKGTMHIFSLRVRPRGKDASNGKSAIAGRQMDRSYSSGSVGSNASSSLSFMKGILPKYFSSEWSFAQFRLPEVTRYITAFGDQTTVMMIGLDGSFYRCSFDPVNGGKMVLDEFIRFMKPSMSRSRTPNT